MIIIITIILLIKPLPSKRQSKKQVVKEHQAMIYHIKLKYVKKIVRYLRKTLKVPTFFKKFFLQVLVPGNTDASAVITVTSFFTL